METKDEISCNLTTRKSAIIVIVLLFGYLFAFGQGNGIKSDRTVIMNEWWSTVFKKHNIDLEKFNYVNTFSMGTDTINSLWLEMGISDSLSSKIVPLRNVIIISRDLNQPYSFMTFQYARHDFENIQLILKNGHWATYDFNLKDSMPIDTASIQEILVDIKMNSISYTDFKNLPKK
jgi:hypothetical protein